MDAPIFTELSAFYLKTLAPRIQIIKFIINKVLIKFLYFRQVHHELLFWFIVIFYFYSDCFLV